MKSKLHVAEECIRIAKESGITLWTNGENLRYRAETGIAPDLRAQLKEHKASIVQVLNGGGEPWHARNVILLHNSAAEQSIFCIHAADGGVSHYIELSYLLSNAASTYGITAYDPLDMDFSPTSIKSIAYRYAEQMVRTQKNCPFYLVGWCSGGPIAFEVARALTAMGHPVQGLVIIDANPTAGSRWFPDFPKQETDITDLELQSAKEWWRFLLYSISNRRPPIPISFWRSSASDKSEFLFYNRENPDILFPGNAMSSAASPLDILNQFRRFNQHASATWDPAENSYAGSITYVARKVPNRTLEEANPGITFWRALTSGHIHQVAVEGNHSAALEHPGVSSLAEVLTALIDAAK